MQKAKQNEHGCLQATYASVISEANRLERNQEDVLKGDIDGMLLFFWDADNVHNFILGKIRILDILRVVNEVMHR